MKTITLKLLFLALIGVALNGCKKEMTEDLKPSLALPTLALNNSQNTHDYVEYNADHNVLMFNSFDDVSHLEDVLNDQIKNYPFDRGNGGLIAGMISQIEQYGYTSDPNGQGNQVNISDFQDLLESSHPLSDEVLSDLIELHNLVALPLSLVKTIFISNIPFSYNISQELNTANLDQQTKSQILQADDDMVDVPNYAYQDFLQTLPGYRSLYSKLLAEEIAQLENGVDPGADDFDNDFIQLDFERLIYNEYHEVYINGYLFKLYEDCKAIALNQSIDNAYQDIQTIDPGGNVTIPELDEGPEGIAEDVMNDHIPLGYIVYNPLEFDPLGGSADDPNYDTALQTFNIIDDCAVSNFAFTPNAAEDFSLQFYNITDLEGLDTDDIYHYWQFGDGTGSFEESPVHSFPGYGTYYVSLTTFSQDCGCWHVHRIPVEINWKTFRGRNPECPIKSVFPVANGLEIKSTVNVGTPVNPNAFPSKYFYHYYDEDPTSGGVSPIHSHETTSSWYDYTFIEGGEYWLEVVVVWKDPYDESYECIAFLVESFYVFESNDPTDCCKKEREKKKTFKRTLGEETYKLKVNDFVRGTFGTDLYRRITTKQKMFRKKKKGKDRWKKQKAWHKIDVYGNYYQRIYILLEGIDVCDLDNPEPHLKYYRSCSNYLPTFSDGAKGFPYRFGLKPDGMTFEHTAYLGGSMNYSDIGPCENVGGVIVFDKKTIKLGNCD